MNTFLVMRNIYYEIGQHAGKHQRFRIYCESLSTQPGAASVLDTGRQNGGSRVAVLCDMVVWQTWNITNQPPASGSLVLRQTASLSRSRGSRRCHISFFLTEYIKICKSSVMANMYFTIQHNSKSVAGTRTDLLSSLRTRSENGIKCAISRLLLHGLKLYG